MSSCAADVSDVTVSQPSAIFSSLPRHIENVLICIQSEHNRKTQKMSFCRITGKSRALPKPNFFPIIPPISPADARRLCRITAKRMDYHNYVPLVEIGRRPGTDGWNSATNDMFKLIEKPA